VKGVIRENDFLFVDLKRSQNLKKIKKKCTHYFFIVFVSLYGKSDLRSNIYAHYIEILGWI